MNRSRAAFIATLQLIATLVGILVALAAVSLGLGVLEGLDTGSQSAVEYLAGTLALLVLLGLGALYWRYLFRHATRPRVQTPEWWSRIPDPLPADGYYDEQADAYIDGTGQSLTTLHAAHLCEGRGCSIHHPSDHLMRSFPTHWRGDRALMERICPHGTGHPDPDHMAWLDQRVEAGTMTTENRWAESVHGCDGCCREGGFEAMQDSSRPLVDRQAELRDATERKV